MHIFRQLGLLALSAIPLVSSVAIDLEKRAPAISVTLSSVSNTVVKAVVKNTASESVSLLKSGSILDSAPVEKATVLKDGARQPFKGLLLRLKDTDLTPEAFTTLAAGATFETTFDIATVTDLSLGGTFSLISSGAFAFPSASGTTLSSQKLPYTSNTLTLTIDGAEAAKVAPALKDLDKRTIVSSCSGSQGTALRAALPRVVSLSNAAASAVGTNNAKMNEYFHSTTAATKNVVAARFRGVAAQAGTTTNVSCAFTSFPVFFPLAAGVSLLVEVVEVPWGLREWMADVKTAIPSQNLIANCNIYYNLPPLTNQCHRQDQATTSLHEFTHAPATYSPGTQDNGYGYAAATALNTQQAINNADTYALFANAIYVGC
ncbi:uncharacterized protein KY384_000447 [Bacidia gigantensis]|uniref:uncharacterized protein n=1 Tax=Bacidia gigantensis TaxID=2732470 RepID=UPI001D0458F7|nr:uncharacterized protein KY384_000447 [Bacidia gigantensis]KAG8525687.1 hypothetical protein KY384_000447 [Bacidia gigantensis]